MLLHFLCHYTYTYVHKIRQGIDEKTMQAEMKAEYMGVCSLLSNCCAVVTNIMSKTYISDKVASNDSNIEPRLGKIPQFDG